MPLGREDPAAAALIGRWQVALETAAAAVRAGWAAKTLSREAGGVELNHIRSEREWLARFEWPSVFRHA